MLPSLAVSKMHSNVCYSFMSKHKTVLSFVIPSALAITAALAMVSALAMTAALAMTTALALIAARVPCYDPAPAPHI